MSDVNAIYKYLEEGRKEMQNDFDDAVRPIHEWLCKYGRPRMKVIVDHDGAEALEDVCHVSLGPPY